MPKRASWAQCGSPGLRQQCTRWSAPVGPEGGLEGGPRGQGDASIGVRPPTLPNPTNLRSCENTTPSLFYFINTKTLRCFSFGSPVFLCVGYSIKCQSQTSVRITQNVCTSPHWGQKGLVVCRTWAWAKFGCGVDCRVWGQPGSKHHRTWKFWTPQLRVRGGQTLLIPPSPFSLLPE